MNYGSILATFALCRLLNNKSGKYPNSKKKWNRAVCGKVWKIGVTAIRAVFQGWNFKQDKGVFRASTDSPKHTDRQRRSGIFKGVTLFWMCYRLYSKLPDFPISRGFLWIPEVLLKGKVKNGQRLKKNRAVYQSRFTQSLWQCYRACLLYTSDAADE